MSRIIAIVQARMGSTRLPGKVMATVFGKPLIEILLARLSYSIYIDQIVLATVASQENDILARFVGDLGYEVWRGTEFDVLDRYFWAASEYQADTIVRITADCPIIDSQVVDMVIEKYRSTEVDYASNVDPPTWPDGLDVEVFSFDVLRTAWSECDDRFSREHVTSFIRSNSNFHKVNLVNPIDMSKERWTVDYPQDLKVIENIVEYFHPNLKFTWQEVAALEVKHPEYFLANKALTQR